jgi:outer membrane protein assembly factor BamA
MNRYAARQQLLVKGCCLFLFFIMPGRGWAYAASDSVYIIQKINIEGNEKTNASIIKRELGFSIGDSVQKPGLPVMLKKAERQLLNTSLFLQIAVDYRLVSLYDLEINIVLKERWYIFPVPVFSLADDNFNVWWRQQMRSLKRINIGMALTYANFTGHNDELSFGFQTGFSNGVGFNYYRPNIGKNKRHEVGLQSFFMSRREVIYDTDANRKSVFRQDDIIVRNKEVKITYAYRKKINTLHSFSLRYSNMRIADTLAALNPQYLGNGRNNIKYLEAAYKIRHIHADNWQYPLKGYSMTAELAKSGFGKWNDINMFRINLNAGRYISYGKKWYSDHSMIANAAFSHNLPFIKQQALGYNDSKILRGLDYFVLNGRGYLLCKNNVKKKLLENQLKLKFLPKQFETIPLRIFLKAFGDAGYVWGKGNKNDRLINRWLFTGGAGIDCVTYYDAAFACEYGWNQFGRPGFFIRMNFGL